MNKSNSKPISKKSSYEKPDLLDFFPDLDYEMIPIDEQQNKKNNKTLTTNK